MDEKICLELLYLVRCGNLDARYLFYKEFVDISRVVAHELYHGRHNDIDREDLSQAGILCFDDIIDNFRNDRNNSLIGYLKRCLRYRMISYLKQNIYIDSMISLNQPYFHRDEQLINFISDTSIDYQPESQFYLKESKKILSRRMKNKERNIDIYKKYSEGYSGKELAKMFHMSERAIYNVIYRMNKQIKRILNERID